MKYLHDKHTTPEVQFQILLVLFATIFGTILRLAFPLMSSFPLNDGGLFYEMIRDLQSNHYSLPIFTGYNSADIPYAYPPLAFYLTGLLADFTNIPLHDLMRVLPPLFSAAAIPVFFILAKEILPSKTTAALAAFLFAFTPRVYEWHIMGGGLTRSLGFLFALFTIYSARKLYALHSIRLIFYTTLWAVFTVLSHPEAIPHTIIAVVITYLFMDRSLKGFLHSLGVAVIVLIFSAPWWLTVISRHGVDPFLSAASTAGVNNLGWFMRFFSIFRFEFTSEPYLPIIAVLGLIGVFYRTDRHAFFLPAWMLLDYLIEPRSGTLYMMLPLVMLAASGLDLIFQTFQNPANLSILKKPPENFGDPGIDRSGTGENKVNVGYAKMINRPGARFFFLFLTVYLLLAGYVSTFGIYDKITLKQPQQNAFDWVRGNTPPDATFLLITGEQPLLDPASDWFPALTGRRSLATVFGYEWLNDGLFSQRINRYEALQKCIDRTESCLESWGNSAMQYSYVYIQKDDGLNILINSLLNKNRYRLVYEAQGVNIFQVTGR